MAWRASCTFADLASVKLSRCDSVLMSQPRIFFFVDQSATPFRNFLREMGYLWFAPDGTLVQKMHSIVWKIFQIICVLSTASPWMKEINHPGRYLQPWLRIIVGDVGAFLNECMLWRRELLHTPELGFCPPPLMGVDAQRSGLAQ